MLCKKKLISILSFLFPGLVLILFTQFNNVSASVSEPWYASEIPISLLWLFKTKDHLVPANHRTYMKTLDYFLSSTISHSDDDKGSVPALPG